MKFKLPLSIFILIYSTYAIASLSESKNFPLNNEQTTILADINAYRCQHGLNALTMNAILSEQAKIHSEEMANHETAFGHDGFKTRMHHIFNQFTHPISLAENVAMASDAARTVVPMWLNSSGHRKNIEGDYNLTGIGIAQGKDGFVYVTQIFLRTNSHSVFTKAD